MNLKKRQLGLGLFLILSILLYSCTMPGAMPTPAPTEAPAEIPAASGPADGTLMSWVDGSTLVFNGDTWVFQSDVTYYQFSLCVEAGNCQPPAGTGEVLLQCNGLPVGEREAQMLCNEVSGSDGEAQLLCNGLPVGQRDSLIECNGFLPTGEREAQMLCNEVSGSDGEVQLLCNGLPAGERDSLIECNGFLPAGQGEAQLLCNGLPLPNADNTDLNNLSVQFDDWEGPGPQAYCAWAGGRVLTETEIAGIGVDSGSPFAETVHGFKCAVDSPHPLAAACETSAFYLNGAPPEMDHTVEEAGAFCQNGQGYVTLDINLMEGAIIQSVDGACEVLDDNRVLCSGEPGSNMDGLAFFSCDELPVAPEGSAPVAGQLQCLPGYEQNIESPATCTIIGPDRSMQDHQFAGQVSLVAYKFDSGSFQGDSPVCGPFLRFDEVLGHCVVDIEVDDLAPAGGFLECDFGFTYDKATGLCLPDVSGWTPPSGHTDCGIGYRFDEEAGICMPDLSGVPTPTPCLAGMTFNQATGLCEPGASDLPSPARCIGPLTFNEATGQCELNLGGWRPPSGLRTCGASFRFDPATGACFPDTSGVPAGPRCLGGMTLNEATGLCEPNTSGWHPPSGERTCGAWFRFDEATGTCIPDVSGVPLPPRCLGGLVLNESTGFCELPMLGCPVGTYYDPSAGICVAPELPSIDSLAGFHFDEASQCNQSDLPSGLYPGCPVGQAFDPLTGACDFENTWIEGGKRIYAVEFNFSTPFCTNSGSTGSGNSEDGGESDGSGACNLSKDICSPNQFDPATCSCYK